MTALLRRLIFMRFLWMLHCLWIVFCIDMVCFDFYWETGTPNSFVIYRQLLASSGDPGTGTGRLIHSLKDLLIPCAKREIRETSAVAFDPVDEFVNFDDPHIKIA